MRPFHVHALRFLAPHSTPVIIEPVRKALRIQFGRIVLAALLLLPAFRAPAAISDVNSDWFARPWRSDEGLPDNNVSGIAQTTDGFLWVGTIGGLVRFDGDRFDEFSPPNVGISVRGIRTLLLDKHDRLWLSMDRGLVVCADRKSAKILTPADGLPSNSQVQVFAEDGAGAIWMAYGARRTVAYIKNDHLTLLDQTEGVPAGQGWISADAKGVIWLAKGGHLCIFRNGKFEELAAYPQSGSVRIVAARKGGIWIFTGSNIWRFEEGGTLEPAGEFAERVAATALLEDHTGALWLGTASHGLFRRDSSGILQPMPSTHRQIECLFEGREGNLWVGTAGGGLDRLRPRALQLIGTEEGLPFESVRSVTQDSTGAMWTVTQNGLLACNNGGTNWSILNRGTNWPGGSPVCVAGDPAGGVWIGTTTNGLTYYRDGEFKTWHARDGLAAENIHGIMIEHPGDVWISFASHIQRFKHGVFQTFDLPIGARYFRAMAMDTAGNVWGGTSEGSLLRIHDGKVIDETDRVQGGRASIRCLYTTPDGSLWIGYGEAGGGEANGGIARYKDGKYARLTTREGLHNNFVSEIVADKMDRLWLAGNGGIFELSMTEVSNAADAVANGRKGRLRSVLYGRAEGLPSLQGTYDTVPSAIRTADGRIWMTTRTGLAVVHTENIHENREVPPVLVERVIVDGLPIAVYDSKSPLRDPEIRELTDLHQDHLDLQLNSHYRKLEIDFTTLSFLAPENVAFRYRLEGVDDQWSEASSNDRKATYLHLSAGNYKFHVIACNNSGVWNEIGATLNFEVQPFFWQRWYFQLAMLAMFTLCVIAIVRYVSFRRLRIQVRQLEQQTVLHKERARIAKDIHDDLGANLTQIALLSELTRQDMAAPVKAGEHVEKISSTARQVMKSLDEIVWAVNPRNDTLPHVVDYLGQFTLDFLRGAPGIRCRLDLPEHPPALNVPADIRHNLFLAVKEALNNIVKHAAAKEVRLGVDVSNGKLRVVVTDDGQGFESPPQDAWADGLRNMRQRMAEIGGECSIESHAGSGTTITFDVPWRN
jgi:signal transduction histidine kinase/ligand-binding sensor domain-containing protein